MRKFDRNWEIRKHLRNSQWIWRNLKESMRIWKNLENLKVSRKIWKILVEFGRVYRDLKGSLRIWNNLNRTRQFKRNLWILEGVFERIWKNSKESGSENQKESKMIRRKSRKEKERIWSIWKDLEESERMWGNLKEYERIRGNLEESVKS